MIITAIALFKTVPNIFLERNITTEILPNDLLAFEFKRLVNITKSVVKFGTKQKTLLVDIFSEEGETVPIFRLAIKNATFFGLQDGKKYLISFNTKTKEIRIIRKVTGK